MSEPNVELWKYFEDRAENLKSSMVTITSWLLGFAGATLAFALDKSVAWEETRYIVRSPLLLMILGLTGLIIVILASMVLFEFGDHLNRNYARANSAGTGETVLAQILAAKPKKRLPNFCWLLFAIVAPFGAAHLMCIALAIDTMW